MKNSTASLLLAALCVVLSGCFVDFTEAVPCDRDDQCPAGFACSAGQCVEGAAPSPEDAGDASPSDAADTGPDGDGPDTSVPDLPDGVDAPEPDLSDDTEDDLPGGPCPEGMFYVLDNPIGRYCVDKYEASRSDATDVADGIDSTRATSRPGVRPWVNVPLSVATSACAGAGKRLCTQDEWMGGCGGPTPQTYPYDSTYQQGICNNSGQIRLTGDFPDCVYEPYGTYDMSGNVAELIDTGDGTTLAAMGGAYNDLTDTLLTCNAEPRNLTPRASVGFRCCADER